MKNSIYILMLIALLAFSGCAGMGQYVPAASPALSDEDQEKLGKKVAGRLLQLQGGPYFDEALFKAINNRLSNASKGQRLSIEIADKSTQAFYVLPGHRVIITRGLLTDISSQQELEQLLTYVWFRTQDPFGGHATRDVVAATNEILSDQGSVYDPDAASIRLAHFFAQRVCEDTCLDSAWLSPSAALKGPSVLPESLLRLKDLQPGFDLLSLAQKEEKGGDPAKAIATYLQAAAKITDEPRILGSLGMAYLRTGELQSARLHLEKAVKLQPDYYRTLMGLGYLYLQQGKISLAKEKLAASVSLLPVAENLFLLAEAMEQGGDKRGARTLYKAVVESGRNKKLARTAVSRLQEMEGKQ